MLARALPHLARLLRERRSVILCYHGVGPTNVGIDPGFLRIRPAVFRAQLELLLEAGFEFVSVSELVISSSSWASSRVRVAASRSAASGLWQML